MIFPKNLYFCVVFRKKHDIFIAQISDTNCNLDKRNNEQDLNFIGVCAMRRLLRRNLGAVAGLCQSMAGLRFLYTSKLVRISERKKFSINLKIKKV